MVVSRADCEVNGAVVDRSRTICTVPGVCARDVAAFFFALDHKDKWDTSVEKIHTLEKHSDTTMVCHIVGKRIWPSAQRDLCV
jgi:collagen type IV alpha-3-binding protein